jgi:hypothetical protein
MQRIIIKSSDRTLPGTTTSSNFSIDSRIIFEGTYQVQTIYCPLNFFNVYARNNQIYFREGGTNKVATIAPGFYAGAATLMTNVAAALTAASGGTNTYTVTQDVLTNALTITASAVGFTLTFGTNTLNSAAELLGFPVVDANSTPLSITASKQWNVATVRCINFIINDIVALTDTKRNSCTVTCPILGDYQSVQYYEPTIQAPQLFTFRDRANTLQIKVVDDNGVELPLQSEWYMIVSKVC